LTNGNGFEEGNRHHSSQLRRDSRLIFMSSLKTFLFRRPHPELLNRFKTMIAAADGNNFNKGCSLFLRWIYKAY